MFTGNYNKNSDCTPKHVVVLNTHISVWLYIIKKYGAICACSCKQKMEMLELQLGNIPLILHQTRQLQGETS